MPQDTSDILVWELLVAYSTENYRGSPRCSATTGVDGLQDLVSRLKALSRNMWRMSGESSSVGE